MYNFIKKCICVQGHGYTTTQSAKTRPAVERVICLVARSSSKRGVPPGGNSRRSVPAWYL